MKADILLKNIISKLIFNIQMKLTVFVNNDNTNIAVITLVSASYI